jgi:hypothetical protein
MERTLVVVAREDAITPIIYRVVSTDSGVRIECTLAEFVNSLSLEMKMNPLNFMSRNLLLKTLSAAADASVLKMKRAAIHNPPPKPT